MSAVRQQVQLDAAVAGHPRIAKRRGRHERVIFSCDDQRGHADAIDDAHGTCAVVVIRRVAEPEMRCGDLLVEFADGPDRVEL